MLATFSALFAAHAVADYLAQTTRMVRDKNSAAMLGLHILIVFGFSAVAVGFTGWAALFLLAGVHGVMDLIKSTVLPRGQLWPYMLDQAVHILTIIGVVLIAPNLFATGIWAQVAPEHIDLIAQILLIAGIAIFAVEAGGYAVELLLRPLPATRHGDDTALASPTAGRRIGQLERGLVLVMMLIGQPAGIAFLIVAKSILRFGIVAEDRAASEYVIIGTLASVGWAMLCGAALIMLLPHTTLEALRLTP